MDCFYPAALLVSVFLFIQKERVRLYVRVVRKRVQVTIVQINPRDGVPHDCSCGSDIVLTKASFWLMNAQ